MNLLDFAVKEANAAGVDPELILKMIQAESSGNHNAVSNKGARGIMQLMPGTAKDMGVDIHDPHDNIRGGVRYFAQQMQRFNDPHLALAAYNAGPANVVKHGGIPPFPETQNYVNKIMGQNMQDDSDIFGGTSSKTASRVGDDSDIFGSSQAVISKPVFPENGDKIYRDLAQKQSFGKNLLAGIGGGMTSLYLGGKQLLGQATPQEINDHKNAMRGLTSTGGGLVGDILGQAAATFPVAMVPGANTYLGSAAIGGGIGALQPTDENDDRATNMVLGAAGGMAGKYVGDKFLKLLAGNPAKGTTPGNLTISANGGGSTFGGIGNDPGAGLTDTMLENLQRGKSLGMKVTPGQASGSKVLQQFESKLESQPITSGNFLKLKDSNQRVMNRAAAHAIGETSDTLDSSVLAAAHERIGNVYKLVADKNHRPIDPADFSGKLTVINDEFEGLLPTDLADNVLVKRLIGFAESGQATGEQLQSLASKLGKAANKNMTSMSGDRDLGMALFKVKDIADDYLASGLNGDTAKKFTDARQQYRNLMLLTQRAGVLNPSTGDVHGKALASLLQQKDKSGFLMGKNQTPMYDAAHFMQAFQPMVPNSGTATRSMLTQPMDALLQMPFNLASGAYLSRPVVGMAGMTGQGIAPNAAQALSNPYLLPLPYLSGGVAGGNFANR